MSRFTYSNVLVSTALYNICSEGCSLWKCDAM